MTFARCLRHLAHRAPNESCTCGFYAVKTREYLVGLGQYHRYTEERPVVIGEVALSGKVIPGVYGWRAEQAWPRSLFVPHVLWRVAVELEAAYGTWAVGVDLDKTLRTELKSHEIGRTVTSGTAE